jgi:hypothetical protein
VNTTLFAERLGTLIEQTIVSSKREATAEHHSRVKVGYKVVTRRHGPSFDPGQSPLAHGLINNNDLQGDRFISRGGIKTKS